MRANFDEFRDISPLFDENQRFLERNEISPNFRRIFESAIVLTILKLYANVPAKIRTTIRKDFRNFEVLKSAASFRG